MATPAITTDRVPPVALVLGSIASVQFGSALGTQLFDRLGPSGTTLLRLSFGAVLLCAVWRPDPRAFTREQWRLTALFGLVLGVMNTSFYLALDRLPIGIAVTVEFVGPLGLAVATSRRRADLGWAAVAGAGILLLADPGGGTVDALGLLFVLVAAGCWAAYILIAQRAGAAFEGGGSLAVAMVIASAVPVVPGVVQAGTNLLDPWLLLLGAGVGILSSFVPFSLEYVALQRIPTNVFGVLMSLEPAVAALAGFVVLGQALGARELLAIGLVVAASVGVTRAASRATGVPVNS